MLGIDALYVWGHTDKDTPELIDFMKKHKIEKAWVGWNGKWSLSSNLLNVIPTAAENSWVKTRPVVIPTKLNEALIQCGSVHLDIEPHALIGWKQNSQAYLRNYYWLLLLIRARYPTFKVSVSIVRKMHTGEDNEPTKSQIKGVSFIDLIRPLVDELSVMAYRSESVFTATRWYKDIPATEHLPSYLAVNVAPAALSETYNGLSKQRLIKDINLLRDMTGAKIAVNDYKNLKLILRDGA